MRAVVVGAGRMGHGIALCFALSGHDVNLVDRDEAALARAETAIRDAAALLVEHDLTAPGVAAPALARISLGRDLALSAARADLIEEAIPEDLVAKQGLFGELESLAPEGSLLATNTSSLRIAAIGARMARPERLIGLHWVAPPYLVPIVEVVRAPSTPVALVERARSLLRDLGKVPVVVPDVAGFAVNRLQYALYAAATDLVDEGILAPDEVDLVVRQALAPRQLAFGQLELFDLVVDGRTVQAVADYLVRETGDERYRPSPRVGALLQEGRRGAADGGGWFDYDDPPTEIERRRDATFALAYGALAALDRDKPPIRFRRS